MLRSLLAAATAARRTARTCTGNPAQWGLAPSAPPAQTSLHLDNPARALFTSTRSTLDFLWQSSAAITVASAGAIRTASTQAGIGKSRSGYQVYCKQQYKNVAKELPASASTAEATNQEVTKELGRRWKAMTEEEQQVYKSQLAPKPEAPAKPPSKRANTGYTVYMQEAMPLYRSKAEAGTLQKDIMTMAAAGWRALSEDQKKQYKDAAERRRSEL